MKVTLEQTEKLLQGEHTFSQLGFSMMLTRLKVMYKKDSSPTFVQTAMGEINAFLDKFKMLMVKDYLIIAEL